MTEVCLVASADVGDGLASELFSYPTARAALSAYELREPYANAVVVETISLGAAVSLLNDLDWYLTRLTSDALVREPSIDESEYLSRAAATAIRDNELEPAAVADRLKLYGVERRPLGDPPDLGAETRTAPDDADGAAGDAEGDEASPARENGEPGADGDDGDGGDGDAAGDGDDEPGRPEEPAASRAWLVEPLYVTRTDGTVPAYDLRPVEETLVVRVTEDEA